MRTTCPAHHILLALISLAIPGEEYKQGRAKVSGGKAPLGAPPIFLIIFVVVVIVAIIIKLLKNEIKIKIVCISELLF
jgi:hypothetical protein